jgi:hypothetical protein
MTLWQPSARLLASAASRMRKRHADWADAMLAEAEFCATSHDRFIWAWGCWMASLRASFRLSEMFYTIALVSGLAVVAVYEWCADESTMTVIILAVVALILGALRPRQALFSGALLGMVVTTILCFEALSGIRPTYKTQAQTPLQSLHWLVLLAPALTAASLGAWIGRSVEPLRTMRHR